jgi:hypothetical protein
MSKKTLVILLLALALVAGLFAVSAGLGSRGGGRVNLSGPGATQISGWLSRPVKAGQLTPATDNPPGCRLENRQILLSPGQTCVFSLAADRLWTLKLRLALATPQSQVPSRPVEPVTVSLEQMDVFPIQQTMVPGRSAAPLELDVYGRQDPSAARLTIHAPDGEGYTLEIVEK